jgi:hypothetical protein
VLEQRVQERTAAFYREIAERQCLECDAQRAAVYDQARGDWVGVVHCAGNCSAAWGQVTVQSVEGQGTTFTLTLAQAAAELRR